MAFGVHFSMTLGYYLPLEMMGSDLEKTKELEIINVFRIIMVARALMRFAQYVAKDNCLIGRDYD